MIQSLAPRPTYRRHRHEIAGAGITPDGAIGTIATSRAINCAGFESIRGVVLLVGGGSVTLQLLELIENETSGTKVLQYVDTGKITGALTTGSTFEFDIHGARVFLRISAVTPGPTEAEVLLAGQEAGVNGSVVPALGSEWEVVQGTAADLKCEPTQTDASKLAVTAKQSVAADLNATIVPGTGWSSSGLVKESGGNLATLLAILSNKDNHDFSGAGVNISIAAMSQINAVALPIGMYRLSGTADCWIVQGAAGMTAIRADGNTKYLAAGAIDFARVSNATTKGFFAIIQDNALIGDLTISRVGD